LVVHSVPHDTVDAVSTALENLHQLMAAARLYGRRHPKTEQAADRLAAQITALFDEAGELEFRVHRNGLRWLGTEIYSDDDNREGIARTLHREGITSFALLPGLDRAEIVTFAELLGLNLNLPRWEEETLSSLLWQQQLRHIAYEAVEHLSDAQELSETVARGEEGYIHEMVRQILAPDPPAPKQGVGKAGALPVRGNDSDGAVPVPGDGSAETVPVSGDGSDGTVPVSGDGSGGPGHPSDSRDVSDPLSPAASGDAAAARADLAASEDSWAPTQHIAAMDLGRWADSSDGELEEEVDLGALRLEVAQDDSATLLARAVSLLLTSAARGRTELRPGEALALLDRALQREEAVEAHLWKSAVELAMRTVSSDAPLLESGRGEIEEWLDRCTRSAAFTAFASSLSSDEPDDVALLERFLSGRDRQRAQLVAQRVGRPGRHLEWVMDHVASIARRDVMALTRGLDHMPLEEALQVLDLLRRMGDQQANTMVAHLLQHRLADVRAAAVKALPSPLPRALLEPVLSRLMDDSQVVRGAVVDLLRTRRPMGAFDRLSQMFGGAAFAEGAAEHKRVIAAGLAAVGGDAAIPLLQDKLQSHGFFAGAEARLEMESCAAALVAIDSLKARMVLKQGAKSLQPGLRRVCREALEGGGR